MKYTCLKPEKITFVIKRTKWELDQLRYGSAATARKIYKKQNKSFDILHSSHERQLNNINLLKENIPDAKFIFHEELPFIDSDVFDLMVSVGGDNHFVHVSHFCGDKPVLGINSDPKTSTGALLGFLPEQAIEAIELITTNDDWQASFQVEQWSRIQGRAIYPDGKRINIPPCTSEISVRSKFHDYISRYLIRKEKGIFEEHKCTGLLLSTGAGSTGWYRNCHSHSQQEQTTFAKDAGFFRSIARETSIELNQKSRFVHVQVQNGENLEIISTMDGEVTIDADPLRVYDFPPGCHIHFFLSDSQLKVIWKK